MRLCFRRSKERGGRVKETECSRLEQVSTMRLLSPNYLALASTELLSVAIQYFHPDAIMWNTDPVMIAGYRSEIAYDHRRVVIGRRTPQEG